MDKPLKLALLLAIIGCGCRADLHKLSTPNGSGAETIISRLIKLENRVTECLTDVKAEMNKLQHQAFNIEERQKSTSVSRSNGPEMCPCDNDSFRSCKKLKHKPSGRYMVSVGDTMFEVYCEQQLDDGGWTVIQNRFDGSVDFNRKWTDYRDGFGDLSREFWLGLEKIHVITSSRPHEMMIRMIGFDGTSAYVRYERFAIDGKNKQYELKAAKYLNGTSGLDYHVNKKFSTLDQDNDAYPDVHCAEQAQSGWWHRCKDLNYSNLNGRSEDLSNSSNYSPLMTWYNFKGYYGLKASKIMIREL